MKRYLRFGEIPANGKSINFLKLGNDRNDRFSEELRMGYVKEAFENIPEECFEKGVSVFDMDENGMPVADTMRLLMSLSSRIDDAIYEVSGDEVDRGNDGEPLVKVEKIEKKRRISKEKLIRHIISVMCKSFKSVEKIEDRVEDNVEAIYHYWCEEKVNTLTGEKKSVYEHTEGKEWKAIPPHDVFYFFGWEFSNPADGFDAGTGIKERR